MLKTVPRGSSNESIKKKKHFKTNLRGKQVGDKTEKRK